MNFIKNFFSQATSSFFNWLPHYTSSKPEPQNRSWFGWLSNAKQKVTDWWNEYEPSQPSNFVTKWPELETGKKDGQDWWSSEWSRKRMPAEALDYFKKVNQPRNEPIDMGIYTDNIISPDQDPYKFLGSDPNESYKRIKESYKRIKEGQKRPVKSPMQANFDKFQELKSKVNQTLAKKPKLT